MRAKTSDFHDGSNSPRSWSVGRVLLTVVWLGVTLLGGFVLIVWASFVETAIAYDIGEHSPLTLPLMVVGTACVWAAGPLAVWATRRTRPWLIATVVLAILGLGTALPKLPAERVQDDMRAIQVPTSWQLELEEESGYGAPLFGESDSATRVFSSSDDFAEVCAAARAALTSWGRGAAVQDMLAPSNSADRCGSYVGRGGTLASVAVYNRAGWDRHSAVMDYDMRNSSARSFITLKTSD